MRPDADPRLTVDDLLELYAIDALDRSEVLAFEAALQSLSENDRERAVEEIRATRDAVGRMAAEYTSAPAHHIRDRILDSIAADGSVAGRAPLRAVPTPSGARFAPQSAEISVPVEYAAPQPHTSDELSVRRMNRRRRIALSVTSAAAAIILVVGGVFVGRAMEPATAPSAPPVAQASPLDELRTVMSAQDAQIHRTKMTGMDGTVVVASSHTLDTAVVLLDGASLPPTQSTYQLWLIGNNHPPKSAGLVNGAINDPLIINGLLGSRTVGMTVEPTGGSPQPTGEVVAAVTL